jgi:hypothetical protein
MKDDHDAPMDGKQKLAELVAGLDGVTPGPWQAWQAISEQFVGDCGRVSRLIDYGSVIPIRVREGFDLPQGAERSECDIKGYANVQHLARCDPDTIRSISDAFSELERERDDLLALIALARPVMRECGWHLAVAAEPQGDGVLEAACTEIEDKFALALGAACDG